MVRISGNRSRNTRLKQNWPDTGCGRRTRGSCRAPAAPAAAPSPPSRSPGRTPGPAPPLRSEVRSVALRTRRKRGRVVVQDETSPALRAENLMHVLTRHSRNQTGGTPDVGVPLRCAPGRAARAVGNDTTVANGAEPPPHQGTILLCPAAPGSRPCGRASLTRSDPANLDPLRLRQVNSSICNGFSGHLEQFMRVLREISSVIPNSGISCAVAPQSVISKEAPRGVPLRVCLRIWFFR